MLVQHKIAVWTNKIKYGKVTKNVTEKIVFEIDDDIDLSDWFADVDAKCLHGPKGSVGTTIAVRAVDLEPLILN